jgi:DNA-binding FrmR family transcriptional regulator
VPHHRREDVECQIARNQVSPAKSVLWAFFFQIVLVVHFALRKRFFESYTLRFGWAVYALSIPAAVISVVRSIKTMVEEGRDCSDILVQIAAVRSAVNQVGRVVLEDHVESCLVTAATDGTADEVWAGLQNAFGVFRKS